MNFSIAAGDNEKLMVTEFDGDPERLGFDWPRVGDDRFEDESWVYDHETLFFLFSRPPERGT